MDMIKTLIAVGLVCMFGCQVASQDKEVSERTEQQPVPTAGGINSATDAVKDAVK